MHPLWHRRVGGAELRRCSPGVGSFLPWWLSWLSSLRSLWWWLSLLSLLLLLLLSVVVVLLLLLLVAVVVVVLVKA